MKKALENILYPVFVILVILFIWQITAWVIDVELILPRPLEAFSNVWNYLKASEFWISLGWTFLRCIESFLLSFILALIFAILSYINKTMEKLLSPLISLVRAIPTMAIILILVISISPHIAPVVISCIVILPTLYQFFLTGFKEIDTELIEMVTVYKVPRSKQIFKFYIPSVLPAILTNSIAGFSLNIKLVIAAEALAQTRNSIGRLMQYAKVSLEMEKLFALTVIAVFLSLFSEFILKILTKRWWKRA